MTANYKDQKLIGGLIGAIICPNPPRRVEEEEEKAATQLRDARRVIDKDDDICWQS